MEYGMEAKYYSSVKYYR